MATLIISPYQKVITPLINSRLLTHRYPFATLAETYERDVINNRELIKG